VSILDKIKHPHIRTFRLVAEAGATRASTALTKWIRKPIGLIVTRVDIVPFKDVATVVGGSETMLVGVYLRMVGDIEGNLMLAFTEPDAVKFVSVLVRHPVETPGEWGELERSSLQETGNILGSAFLNAMADALDYDIKPTSPSYARDYTSALIESVLMDYAEVGDKAIVIDTTFSQGGKSDDTIGTAHLLLLPTPASLEKIMARLGLK